MPTRIVYALADVPADPHVVTIGNFDGVHLGHQHLIDAVVRRARERGVRSLVMTFDPLPVEVLRPDRAPRRLNATDRRVALIAALGVDTILVQPFSLDFAGWPAHEFVRRLVAATHPVEVIVGADFAFGHDRTGNAGLLTELGPEYGFTTTVVERVGDASSTAVRQAIGDGDVAAAARLLGHPHTISGVVEAGARRGRSLGFPTANLNVPATVATPPDGIYAVLVSIHGNPGLLPAIAYLGPRPTFDGGARTIEVYLFDFAGDLYGHDLSVLFIDRVRGDVRFDSAQQLIEQMQQDERDARAILANTGEIGPQAQTAALIGASEGAHRRER